MGKWGNGAFAALGFAIRVGDESVWWWRFYLGLGLENSCLGHKLGFFFFFFSLKWRSGESSHYGNRRNVFFFLLGFFSPPREGFPQEGVGGHNISLGCVVGLCVVESGSKELSGC